MYDVPDTCWMWSVSASIEYLRKLLPFLAFVVEVCFYPSLRVNNELFGDIFSEFKLLMWARTCHVGMYTMQNCYIIKIIIQQYTYDYYSHNGITYQSCRQKASEAGICDVYFFTWMVIFSCDALKTANKFISLRFIFMKCWLVGCHQLCLLNVAF